MKFEFGDFYKFVVSLGIVLVGLAFIVPWLFLSQPFDLLVEAEKIKLLTQSAQTVICQRQQVIEWIIGIIPTFTWISGVLGGILFFLGGFLWWRKSQSLTDEYNKLNLELLKRQLKPASTEELQEKVAEAKAEIDEVEPFEPLEGTKERLTTSLRFDVIEFESKLKDKLSSCFLNTHEILVDQRLGSAMFDYVLLSKHPSIPDYVIETKYLRYGFQYGWLKDNAIKQVLAATLYQKDAHRKVVPVLLVAAPKELLKRTSTDNYIKRIKNDPIVRSSNVTVSFLDTEEMDSLDCSQLHKLIS